VAKTFFTKRRVCAFLIVSAFSIGQISVSNADVLEDAHKERVTINAGDVTLGATLYRPASISGDLPGIVTAHGSAPSTREDVGFYTYRALEMGFAVLSFDKRGAGESTGEYVPFAVNTSEEMMRDLAADVVYSIEWLAQQPGIDDTRLGLFGGSQAGWIMPLAASKEPLIKFIVTGEGAPVTAGEEAVHGDVGGDGEGWDRARIHAADDALWEYQGNHGFDPTPVLLELDVPTLWIFGLRDDVIPVYPSLERLENLIRDGKTNNAIHIFPFGDHNFRNTATGDRYDVRQVAQDWLTDIGVLE